MRENWTYKKLGEVCEIEYGTRVVQARDGGSIYPVYGGGGATFMMDTYNRENRVVVSRFAMSKKCTRKVIGKFFLNDSGLTIKSKEPLLLQNYLDTFILSSNDKIYHLGRGLAQKNLKVPDLLQIDIAIPNAEVQLSIVAELDKINELISLKKAQLSDLDTLAQSIFYDMFGDPIENEKGWEVKKLGEVCDVRDGTHDSPQYLSESEYFLITSKNIQGDIIDYANVNYISKEDYDSINKRSYVDEGDIIMGMIGTIGKPIIVHKNNLKFCVKNVALIKFPESCLVKNVYVKALLDNDSYKQYLLSLNKGGTQKFVALGTLRTLKCPLPPLSLQQDFAKRIELIEQQKAQISSTIKDLETLLASRMQYWFD